MTEQNPTPGTDDDTQGHHIRRDNHIRGDNDDTNDDTQGHHIRGDKDDTNDDDVQGHHIR